MFDPRSVPASLRNTQDSIAARIEDASLSVAQPSQQSFYDGWLLRYSPGKARRARSVNAIGGGVLPFAEKLAHSIGFYARHRLPCLFRMTPFSQPHGLDGALADAGFVATGDTRVMRLAMSEVAVSNSPQGDVRVISVEQFTAAFGRLHGLDAATMEAERERYTRSAIDGIYLAQFDADVPIACGSIAVEGLLAGIFGMVTASSHRGRGFATTLVGELLAHAGSAGATVAYLQVEADNTPARRVYEKFGFEDCYAYWYRMPGDGGTTGSN